MSREASIQWAVEGMGSETPLLLQVGDECPDFVVGDFGQTHAARLSTEKPIKAVHAGYDDRDCIGAFSLSRGTELVAGDEAL